MLITLTSGLRVAVLHSDHIWNILPLPDLSVSSGQVGHGGWRPTEEANTPTFYSNLNQSISASDGRCNYTTRSRRANLVRVTLHKRSKISFHFKLGEFHRTHQGKNFQFFKIEFNNSDFECNQNLNHFKRTKGSMGLFSWMLKERKK